MQQAGCPESNPESVTNRLNQIIQVLRDSERILENCLAIIGGNVPAPDGAGVRVSASCIIDQLGDGNSIAQNIYSLSRKLVDKL